MSECSISPDKWLPSSNQSKKEIGYLIKIEDIINIDTLNASDASKLLIIADLLMPAQTSAKQEGLKNLLAVVDRLQWRSPEWQQAFAEPKNKRKIEAMRQEFNSASVCFIF